MLVKLCSLFEIISLFFLSEFPISFSLHPPNKVRNIHCFYDSYRSCEIRWKNEGFTYTIKKQDSYSLNWHTVARNIASNLAYNEYIVDEMVLDERYMFSVIANNPVGQSDESVAFYHHK